MSNCKTAQKSSTPVVTVANPTVFYDKDIVPIINDRCTPCHMPPDGKVLPLNTYDAVKGHIDEVIKRVKLPSTERGFMPLKLKKPALTAEMIATLEKWKQEGFAKSKS